MLEIAVAPDWELLTTLPFDEIVKEHATKSPGAEGCKSALAKI